MSKLFDEMAGEIFSILKANSQIISLYDNDGNKTYEPSLARKIFCDPSKIMVILNESGEQSIEVSLSKTTDVEANSSLLESLRNIASRYIIPINVQTFGKELTPRDFSESTKMNEAISINQNYVGEMAMYIVSGEFLVDVWYGDCLSSWEALPGDIISTTPEGYFVISRDNFVAELANTPTNAPSVVIDSLLANGLISPNATEDGEDFDVEASLVVRVALDYKPFVKELISQFDELDLIKSAEENGTRIVAFNIPKDTPMSVEDYCFEIEIFAEDSGIPVEIFHYVSQSSQEIVEDEVKPADEQKSFRNEIMKKSFKKPVEESNDPFAKPKYPASDERRFWDTIKWVDRHCDGNDFLNDPKPDGNIPDSYEGWASGTNKGQKIHEYETPVGYKELIDEMAMFYWNCIKEESSFEEAEVYDFESSAKECGEEWAEKHIPEVVVSLNKIGLPVDGLPHDLETEENKKVQKKFAADVEEYERNRKKEREEEKKIAESIFREICRKR